LFLVAAFPIGLQRLLHLTTMHRCEVDWVGLGFPKVDEYSEMEQMVPETNHLAPRLSCRSQG
jgi:hypothetical protein